MASILQPERTEVGPDSELFGQESLAQENRTPSAGLLLIIGEPITVEQKDLIFERIVTELSTWDQKEAHSDIDQILGVLAASEHQAINGPNGEKTFHHNCYDGNVIVDVLVNPRLATLTDSVGAFLHAPIHYRHLVYAGLTMAGSGSWIVQDGLFSFRHLFQAAAKKSEDQSEPQTNQVLVLSVFTEGEWTEDNLVRVVRKSDLVMRLNPGLGKRAELETSEEGIIRFADGLSTALSTPLTSEILQPTAVVGNISFARPTLYIFPAGDGDSALFGISGFTMLVDGGFPRRACFWDFAKHLTKIDALVLTHVSGDSILGLSAFFERKAQGGGDKGEEKHIHPELGVVFMNVGGGERNGHASNTSSVHTLRGGGLLVSVADECINMVDHMHHLGLKPLPILTATASVTTPVNLYYKIGHGSLDMYILNPIRESQEFNDFLNQWVKNVDTYGPTGRPVTDNISVACVVVWSPASPLEPVTRIMFTGGLPQSKLFDGLNRLSSLALFQSRLGVQPLTEENKKLTPRENGGVATVGNKAVGKIVPRPATGKTLTQVARSASTPTAGLGSDRNTKRVAVPTVAKDAKKSLLVKTADEKRGKVLPSSAKGASAESSAKSTDQPAVKILTKKVFSKSEHRDISSARTAPATESKIAASSVSTETCVGSTSTPKTASNSASLPITRIVPKNVVGTKNKKGDLAALSAPISHKKNVSENINNSHVKKANLLSVSADGVKQPKIKGVEKIERDAKESSDPISITTDTNDSCSVDEVSTCSLEMKSLPNLDERIDSSASVDTGIQISAATNEILSGEMLSFAEAFPKSEDDVETTPLNLASHHHSSQEEDASADVIHQCVEEPEIVNIQDHQIFMNSEDALINNEQNDAESFLEQEDNNGKHGREALVELEEKTIQLEEQLEDLIDSEPHVYEAQSALNGFEAPPSSKDAKNVIDLAIGIPSEDAGEVMESANNEFDPQRDWELPQNLPAPVGVGSECDAAPTSDPVSMSFAESESSTATAAKEPLYMKLKQSQSATGERNGAKTTGQASAVAGNCTDVKSVGGSRRSTHEKVMESAKTSTAEKTGRGIAMIAVGEGDSKRNGASPTPSSLKKSRATQSNETTAAKKTLKATPVVAAKSCTPVFVDLVYVPRSGVDAAFYRRLRASTYVMSAARPDVKQFDILVDTQTDALAAPIRIIPTHSSDELANWIVRRGEDLERLSVTILPAADRCTIQLQEQDTSCCAYRLEF